MFSKKGRVKGNRTITIIAEGVKIEGKLQSPGSIRIDGTVNGDIVVERELIVGKEGEVEANVKTENAVIAGLLKGDMIASGEVEITSTGKFIGNLTQKEALLTIDKGGLFKGESIISENKDIFKIEDKEIISKEKTKSLRIEERPQSHKTSL